MSRIIDLARKLKALAEDGRGNSHEEGNAARLLEKYVKHKTVFKRGAIWMTGIYEEELWLFMWTNGNFVSHSKLDPKLYIIDGQYITQIDD